MYSLITSVPVPALPRHTISRVGCAATWWPSQDMRPWIPSEGPEPTPLTPGGAPRYGFHHLVSQSKWVSSREQQHCRISVPISFNPFSCNHGSQATLEQAGREAALQRSHGQLVANPLPRLPVPRPSRCQAALWFFPAGSGSCLQGPSLPTGGPGLIN